MKILQKHTKTKSENLSKVWDEISFVKPAETNVEELNRTYVFEKDKVKKRFILMKKRLQDMYGYKYPIQRRVMEERIVKLEKQFNGFDYMINPYHIQPGLLLDLDITSIKRKKATLDGMANVMNEFLFGVSKGFQDAAFAAFSRRRSTVRSDINQSFVTDLPGEGENPADSYLDLLNDSGSDSGETQQALTVDKPESKKSGRKKSTGIVDNSKKKKPGKRQSGNKLSTI